MGTYTTIKKLTPNGHLSESTKTNHMNQGEFACNIRQGKKEWQCRTQFHKTYTKTSHTSTCNQVNRSIITPCIIIIRGVFTNFYANFFYFLNFFKKINLTKKAIKHMKGNEEKVKKWYLKNLWMSNSIISLLVMWNVTYRF